MSKKVYYDDSCPVCHFEIKTIRKRGESCGIQFIDISDPSFDNGGLDYESEMIGEFGGVKTGGAETIRRMYEEMGFKKTVCFSRLPLIRLILDLGYHVFARWIRPNLPKKKKNV
jgi:predicted DCC family thiol-disulfide oxidoreductase YuxK